MRILITGGNGFLGSWVSEMLSDRGHELRLLLRPTSNVEFLENVTYQRAAGDIRDAASLRSALNGIDTVVHLAGLTTALREADYIEVNQRGTQELVDAAVQAGVSRFVYVSSLSALGPSPDGRMPAPEDTPRPISAYGRSKLAGERPVLAQKERMQVAVLRPPAVYGPRDRDFIAFFRLIGRFRLMPFYSDGLNQVSWINVVDCATAIVEATEKLPRSGAIYTMSDGETHTWRDLVDALAQALGKKPLRLYLPPALFQLGGYAGGLAGALLRKPMDLTPEKVLQMSQRYWLCDNQRITAELGWRPTISTPEGVSQTLAWYRQHDWL